MFWPSVKTVVNQSRRVVVKLLLNRQFSEDCLFVLYSGSGLTA
jgi:hypothetical protein